MYLPQNCFYPPAYLSPIADKEQICFSTVANLANRFESSISGNWFSICDNS